MKIRFPVQKQKSVAFASLDHGDCFTIGDKIPEEALYMKISISFDLVAYELGDEVFVNMHDGSVRRIKTFDSRRASPEDFMVYPRNVIANVEIDHETKEQQKYGFFSAKAAEKWGSSLWKTPSGAEVEVTCVSTDQEIPSGYLWADTVCRGAVVSYSRETVPTRRIRQMGVIK